MDVVGDDELEGEDEDEHGLMALFRPGLFHGSVVDSDFVLMNSAASMRPRTRCKRHWFFAFEQRRARQSVQMFAQTAAQLTMAGDDGTHEVIAPSTTRT